MLLEVLKEVMIETHLAELIDEHGRVARFRACQETPQQRRFAATQKTRDERDGSPAPVHGLGSRVASGWPRAARNCGSSGSSRRLVSCCAAGQISPRSRTKTVLPLRSLR